jgi:hypothetical protein
MLDFDIACLLTFVVYRKNKRGLFLNQWVLCADRFLIENWTNSLQI